MIKAILIFNNHGKPRLSKFYQPYVSIPPPPIRERGESLAAGSALRATPSGAPRPVARPGRLALPGLSASRRA